MSAFEIFLLVFNASIFVWVAFYRPWKAGQRREASMKRLRGIPQSQWEWLGTACHFVLADRCRWRLHTHVGRHCISSLGNLRDQAGDGPQRLDGAGTGKGPEMLYETMVFVEDGSIERYDCRSVDEDRYETAKEAAAGHMAMCRKYAGIDP